VAVRRKSSRGGGEKSEGHVRGGKASRLIQWRRNLEESLLQLTKESEG